jgi:hypothetical protein
MPKTPISLFKCKECGDVSLKRVCYFCQLDDDSDDTELTAEDEAAFKRYEARKEFDYWHGI